MDMLSFKGGCSGFYGRIANLKGWTPNIESSLMSMNAVNEGKATRETVTDMRRWNERLITFRITRPKGYQFVPGQYSRLGLEGEDGSMIWRAYSITSGPDEDTLEYYGIVVPNGLFTTQMDKLQVGDAVWLEKNLYGFMTADRFSDGDELWMLATGTGIGPFISMLRDPAVWQRFSRLVLVHGVRHAQELSYAHELRAMRDAPPFPGSKAQLTLLQAVSREEAQAGDAHRLHGRITTLLENGELERAAGLPLTLEHSRVMLCGNPDMIEDTRKLLHARGMRPCRRMNPGHFVTENYW
jgi:ferredoxin--NADP+ reductase